MGEREKRKLRWGPQHWEDKFGVGLRLSYLPDARRVDRDQAIDIMYLCCQSSLQNCLYRLHLAQTFLLKNTDDPLQPVREPAPLPRPIE